MFYLQAVPKEGNKDESKEKASDTEGGSSCDTATKELECLLMKKEEEIAGLKVRNCACREK